MPGEILEKATRILTDEEKLVLDQDWVGKDGSKRKLEVSMQLLLFHQKHKLTDFSIADHGPSKAKEIFPI